MNQAFGEDTEVMLMIAQMACNLDPETVDMGMFHFCDSMHCILGHAEVRQIISDSRARRFVIPYGKWFGTEVTLTPKEIGYQILDRLGIEHIGDKHE